MENKRGKRKEMGYLGGSTERYSESAPKNLLQNEGPGLKAKGRGGNKQ